MERFWKIAVTVGGVAGIGAFVFWSLYKQWLALPIFSQLSPEHTFWIMILFLVLTFGALVVLGLLYLARPRGSLSSDHAFKLHDAWKDVNEIDCERLIGPDVTNAARAMTITASSWLNGLVDRKVIVENHFEDFDLLYRELLRCDRIVPGFEKRGLTCKDFVSEEMHRAYREMGGYKAKGTK